MPIATSILLAGAALALGVGTAVKGVVDARQAAAAQKKQIKAQERAAADALAAKPSKSTGADVEILTSDKTRRRGKGSLAARNRTASLGVLGGESAAAVGGL